MPCKHDREAGHGAEITDGADFYHLHMNQINYLYKHYIRYINVIAHTLPLSFAIIQRLPTNR
jgi:hypothetical protein